MEHKCAIRGENYQEEEGLMWAQLRPAVQEFLKTVKPDLLQDSFISYNALNDLLRAYVTDMTAAEVKEQQELAQKVEQQFTQNKDLKPITPHLEDKPRTLGERLADKIADFGGSWRFIIIFGIVLVVWMAANLYVLHNKGFDPYPFILLNLVLSCIAAMQAPVIMMSQNRQEDKDRARNKYDFQVNLKAETEVRLLHEKVDQMLLHHHKNMTELLQLQLDMMQQMQQRMDALQKPADTNKKDAAENH